MIRYSLRCAKGHEFDSWFQSGQAYDVLAAKGLVTCAVCGSRDVTKAVMAPKVVGDAPARLPKTTAPNTPTPAATAPLRTPAHPMEKMLRALKEHVNKTSTYVGDRFAAEARAMHLGDVPEKPIHGEAKPEDARALIQEGVPIAPLPVLPSNKVN